MIKKLEDPILATYLISFPLIDNTHNDVSINSPLPHLGRGDFTRVEPFLIDEPLKPRVKDFLHHYLLRGKRTRPGAIGIYVPVKVKRIPLL